MDRKNREAGVDDATRGANFPPLKRALDRRLKRTFVTAALASGTQLPFKSRAMQTHQKRPVRDELEELYGIAVKQHGADSRAGRMIRRALEQEQRDAAPAADESRRQPTDGERPR